MSIRFFNTASRSIEDFKPQNPPVVTLYTCGPTVYNYPHIGNFRTFLFEDLLKRWLEYRGFQVKHVMNLTDVDDKTIRNSQAQKMNLNNYTDIYKKAFFENLKTLNVEPATKYPAATEHIDDMVSLIEILKENGYAYKTEDGVYYRVSSFPEYGKLAHIDRDKLLAGAGGRVTNDEYDRENISDFALWKKWSPEDGDVKWHSPWGDGRPGWHIECSVMSMKYLGQTIDIHAGGVDLIFPHHENEIAQSEAATGKKFVNYWLHAAHLVVDGKKMSKSIGNFYTLRDLLDKGFSPRALRYALITTHYRKPLNFTLDSLHAAQSSLERLDDFILMLRHVKNPDSDTEINKLIKQTQVNFENTMDNDLNIAEAMGLLFSLIKQLYDRQKCIGREDATTFIAFFEKLDTVLGFLNMDSQGMLSKEEQKLLNEHQKARENKDFVKSDEYRDMLLERGIEVRDTPDGPVWKRVK